MAYHDDRPHPDPRNGPYLAVCNVRSDGSRPGAFPAYDDDGGFPERNASYCELSVLRRLETRASTDLVGLCHYRRVLVARAPRAPRGEHPGSFAVAHWDWTQVDAHAAGTPDLVAALGDRDWCTPQPYDVRRSGFRSLAEQFAANHPAELIGVADAAVAARHPHLPSFAGYLRTAVSTPLFNIFLGRRQVLLEYTAFLWPVLEACAAGWTAQGSDQYQTRWAGFLAERLHGYWLRHAAGPAGVTAGTLPLAVLDRVGVSSGSWPPRRPARSRARLVAAARGSAVSRLPPAMVLAAHQARWRLDPGADPRRAGAEDFLSR